MATKVKESEAQTDERAEAAPDGPLLDLSDDAVKKMIKAAKKRGFVTMDKLNSMLSSDDVTSDQVEDLMAMLNDMGINVVEDEEEPVITLTQLVGSSERLGNEGLLVDSFPPGHAVEEALVKCEWLTRTQLGKIILEAIHQVEDPRCLGFG